MTIKKKAPFFNRFSPVSIRVFMVFFLILSCLFSGAWGYFVYLSAFAFFFELSLLFAFLLLIIRHGVSWGEIVLDLLLIPVVIFLMFIVMGPPSQSGDAASFAVFYTLTGLFGVWFIGLITRIFHGKPGRKNQKNVKTFGFPVFQKNSNNKP